MRVATRSFLVAFVAASLSAILTGCVPTATSNMQDVAQAIVEQLPNSSAQETPARWIAEFRKRGSTGTDMSTLVDVSTRAWGATTWANDRSIAYELADAGRMVRIDMAIRATGTAGGVPGINDASYVCARAKLSPGKKAVLSEITCPDQVIAAADGALRGSLDGTLHGTARRPQRD